MRFKFSVLIILLAILCCGKCQVPPSDDDWATAKQKAVTFVNKLSIEEKVALATGVGWQKGKCVGNTPAIDRVGYPGLCLEDSPTGVRFTDKASAFPAGINVATTWNKTLIYERSLAMGAEFRGKGVNVALTPMMNIGRVAAGGRNWEGFGADPYLTGEAAYWSVLGIQANGVLACAKHYIGNEQEHFRTSESSNIDERTLHEVYEWPFIRSVQAGVGSVMCSYNKVNNTYACENNYTLNVVLKGEFGYRGYIMSDWSATMSGVPSVLAGLDMTMPGDITMGSGTSYFGQNLTNAVKNGQVSQERLTDMGTRIMTPWFLFGQDKNFPAVNFDFRDPNAGEHVDVQGNHAEVIRKIGADSNVLLKNSKSVLPFGKNKVDSDSAFTYALIGQDAGPSPRGPNGCADHGCDEGTLAQGWGSGTSNFPYLVTPLEGITNRAKANGQTVVSSLSDSDLDAAKKMAASADFAIVFGNADSGEQYITVEGNEGDRNDLNLWHNANALIEAVASANTRTVVVIHSVGPVLMPWIDNPNIVAVVMAGLPGQESGNSLADVLFGDVNPSGKLVFTLAQNRSNYPADVVYSGSQQIDYKEGLLVDYKWFDAKNIEPLFPFGFGLSYTTFTYSNIKLSPVSSSDDKDVAAAVNVLKPVVLYKVSVTLTNTGNFDGEEVAQLYLSFPESAGEPPKILRGFEKVNVPKGKSVDVVFYLTDLEISTFVVSSSSWVIPSGEFKVMVGSHSRSLPLVATFSR